MPKKGGGLGLKNIRIFNINLRRKLRWKLSYNEEKNWVKICQEKYLDPTINFLNAT